MAQEGGFVVFGQCRICSKKGKHRDFTKVYYWNCVREVYAEIFNDCFKIQLSTTASLPNLICTACVQRLRESNDFRRMAISAERQLVNQLSKKETEFVNVVDTPMEHDDINIKTEVKMEEVETEYEDDDDDYDYVPDSDYGPDEDDPKPVNKQPKRAVRGDTTIWGEAELIARFDPSELKLLPTRGLLYDACANYARQLDLLQGKVILPHTIEKLLDQRETPTVLRNNRQIVLTEKLAQITNVSTILENSNAVPFKSRSRLGYPCFYCRDVFEKVEKLREHHKKDHQNPDIKRLLSTQGVESLVVYVDILDLKCKICHEPIPTLNSLKSHLVNVHKKVIYTDYTDRMIPFKLSNINKNECQVCGFSFETFGSIERHMNVHYRNYVCDECGSGFVTKYRLKVHGKSMHVGGSYPCDVCNKIFSTQQKHKNHVDAVHKMVKRFKCPKCPERFSEYFRRQKHMVLAHGVAPLTYKCNVCDKEFDRRYTLSRHLKRDHLEERDFQCNVCSYKCFTNNELKVHMVKHNGERIFECSVCKKSYARKKTLKEHMRIHNNDRRFSCAVCGQAFVQKCSLKGHMKTHHMEYHMQ